MFTLVVLFKIAERLMSLALYVVLGSVIIFSLS